MTAVAPGYEFDNIDRPLSRGPALNADRWFIVDAFERGPTTPQKLGSIVDLETVYGVRQPDRWAYDAADLFFEEGGRELWVARAVGLAPAAATLNVPDSTPATTFVATAASVGAWANAATLQVTQPSGTTYTLIVTDPDGTVETSPAFADKQSGIDWAAQSNVLRLTSGAGSGIPAVMAATPLAGGTDDRVNIADAQYQTALNGFSRDLGPGQVSFPGRTTQNAHTALLTHADQNNRRAVLDLPDTATKATLKTLTAVQRPTLPSRKAAAFGPWVTIPSLAAGLPRVAPASALVAGVVARNDLAGVTPGQPSAGDEYGVSAYATGVTQQFPVEADRADLNDAGVNLIRVINGGVELYGYRTLTDPTLDPNWVEFSGSRVVMAIQADAEAIESTHVFRLLDGKGHEISAFHADLVALCERYYQDGALYGDTSADAYRVDTGPGVNPPENLAQRILSGQLEVKTSPFAERVKVFFTKRAITEVL